MNQSLNKGKEGMVLKNLPAYFLFGCLAIVVFYLFKVIEPFILVLIFAAIVATVTYPLYLRFLRFFKNRARVASVSTCFAVLITLVIPLIFFIILLSRQAVDIYKYVDEYVQHTNWDQVLSWKPGNFFYDIWGNYQNDLLSFIDIHKIDLKTSISESAREISSFVATQTAKVLTSVGKMLFKLLLFFFTLYFFYKDGKTIVKKIMVISPIPLQYEKEIIKKFIEISRATLYGTFLTAIAQGFVAWIGFMIAGVPSAFFWATAVSVFSLVPIVGTTLVWIPAGFLMLASGHIFGGLFVLVWGAALISTVDNLLRIIFIGGTAKLNPLLTFLTVIGGVAAFHLIGVILGPMLMVLFLTFLHIYELEYDEMLKVQEIYDSGDNQSSDGLPLSGNDNRSASDKLSLKHKQSKKKHKAS